MGWHLGFLVGNKWIGFNLVQCSCACCFFKHCLLLLVANKTSYCDNCKESNHGCCFHAYSAWVANLEPTWSSFAQESWFRLFYFLNFSSLRIINTCFYQRQIKVRNEQVAAILTESATGICVCYSWLFNIAGKLNDFLSQLDQLISQEVIL